MQSLFAIASAVLLLAAQRGEVPARGVDFWNHFVEISESDPAGQPMTLALMLLDADGDRRKEIFLGVLDFCGTGGCPWWVYSPTARAGEVRYLGATGFSPAGFQFNAATHELTYCWHMSAEACALGTNLFRGGRMIDRSGGTCHSGDVTCERRLDAIRDWQRDHPTVLYYGRFSTDAIEWTDRDRRVQREGIPDFDHLRVVR